MTAVPAPLPPPPRPVPPSLLPHGADPGGGAAAMNPSGLPCSSPSPVLGPPAAGVGAAGLAGGGGAGAGGGGGGGGAVKLKFCRYYAKDKTCFYGEECQFLHEEPGAAPAGPGPAAPLGALPLGLPPAAAAAAGPGYPVPHGASPGPAAAVVGPKKAELGAGGGGGGGGGGGAGLDGPRLASEYGEDAPFVPGRRLPSVPWCYRKQITTAMVAGPLPGPPPCAAPSEPCEEGAEGGSDGSVGLRHPAGPAPLAENAARRGEAVPGQLFRKGSLGRASCR